jgi:hypothetical protein
MASWNKERPSSGSNVPVGTFTGASTEVGPRKRTD